MKNLKLVLSAVLALSSIDAYSEGGDRVGNGGDAVVTSDGAIRLRDLVDPGTCRWVSGKTILAKYPVLRQTLDKLNQGNEFFAYGLEQQITRIRWCYTGVLKQINTNDDQESLTYYVDPYADKKVQAAIRVVNDVFINEENEKSMKLEDRPFLYIHEAMHAFLPMYTPKRNQRVRDAVAGLENLYKGVTNLDDVDALIDGSQLLVPHGSSELQNLVRILRNPQMPLQERVRLAQEILPAKNDLKLREDWAAIRMLFSDRDLITLTQRTGLARFEFFLAARNSISFDLNNTVQFKRVDPCKSRSSSYSYICKRVIISKKLFSLGLGRCVFSGPVDRVKFWVTISDRTSGKIIEKLKAHREPIEGTIRSDWSVGLPGWSSYDGSSDADKEGHSPEYFYFDEGLAKYPDELFEKLFVESICDFTPTI